MKPIFRSYLKNCCFIQIVFLLLTQPLFSQHENVNTDSLLKEAQHLVNTENYTEANKISYKLLALNPDNYDAHILIANSYMREKKFAEAKVHIDYLLNEYGDNKALLATGVNWYYWSEDYLGCVNQCDNALIYYPNDSIFEQIKITCLIKLKNYTYAATMVDSMLLRDANNTMAKKLQQQLFLLSSKNRLTISTIIDFYENNIISPTQLSYIEYARKIKSHTAIARLNYANRFNQDAIQLEIDAYITASEKAYFYYNMGYSRDSVFPHYRLGAEWYQVVGKGNEFSLGTRFLSFYPADVFIYTASYGKYIGSWWVNLRTYLNPVDNMLGTSALFTVRRYCAKHNYIGLQLKSGVNPDQRANVIDPSNNYFLQATGVKLEYNTLFLQRWIAGLNFMLEKQEYFSNKNRNVFSAEFRLSYLF